MLVIAGHVLVDPSDRDAYVAAFADLVARARQAPGCHDVAITADSSDPARVYNLEIWESEEHLDAWREVCDPPQVDTAIRADHVRRYDVSDVRSPF